jgi:hypothetical protein
MKKSLLITGFLLSFILTSKAQTNITTWYIIPPTSGCNGVWAIDQTQSSCGSTYLFNPSFPTACGSFLGAVADTMFIQLCSMPCDLTILDSSGVICGFCGTGTTTDVGEQSSTHIVTTYPNPATTTEGCNIWLQPDAQTVSVNIYNAFGQLVLTQSAANTESIFHVNTSSLSAGTYFSEVIVNDAAPFRQMLVMR